MSEPVTSRFAPKAYGQRLRQGAHELLADTGEKTGGGGAGMDPHALVAAALAACTGMTLWMYAERKGWPLTDAPVEVDLRHEGGRTVVQRRVRLEGALDDAQRQRLRDIADRCPIHQLLTGEVEVHTELAP